MILFLCILVIAYGSGLQKARSSDDSIMRFNASDKGFWVGLGVFVLLIGVSIFMEWSAWEYIFLIPMAAFDLFYITMSVKKHRDEIKAFNEEAERQWRELPGGGVDGMMARLEQAPGGLGQLSYENGKERLVPEQPVNAADKPSKLAGLAAFGTGAYLGYNAFGESSAEHQRKIDESNERIKQDQKRSRAYQITRDIEWLNFQLTQNRTPREKEGYRARISTLEAELAALRV